MNVEDTEVDLDLDVDNVVVTCVLFKREYIKCYFFFF